MRVLHWSNEDSHGFHLLTRIESKYPFVNENIRVIGAIGGLPRAAKTSQFAASLNRCVTRNSCEFRYGNAIVNFHVAVHCDR
jgi:hypothetical protein